MSFYSWGGLFRGYLNTLKLHITRWGGRIWSGQNWLQSLQPPSGLSVWTWGQGTRSWKHGPGVAESCQAPIMGPPLAWLLGFLRRWLRTLTNPLGVGRPCTQLWMHRTLGEPSVHWNLGLAKGSVVFVSELMRVCMPRHFSPVQLCVTPWTVARQAPLSVGFSRQECWSRLPCPPRSRDLSNPGIKSASLKSSALAGGFLFFVSFFFFFLPLVPPGKPFWTHSPSHI